MSHWAAATDDNQAIVVRALREVGASVTLLHRVGLGCPDLLVGFRRQTFLIEVKDGDKPPSARKLTPDQEIWHRIWRGLPVAIVLGPQQALAVIGAA